MTSSRRPPRESQVSAALEPSQTRRSAPQGSQGRIRLWASITSLSPLSVRDDALRLENAGVDGLHLDIADAHFAPFLTFGPRLACVLRKELRIPIEVHLMTDDPESYIRQLADCGIERLAFHVESTRHPWRVASLGRNLGFEMGAALNPVTAVSVAGALGSAVDYVNLLSTDHDFAGDHLLAATANRVVHARKEVPTGVRIQVDGAVDASNIGSLVAVGADDLVVGRAICEQVDWTAAVADLRRHCEDTIPEPEESESRRSPSG